MESGGCSLEFIVWSLQFTVYGLRFIVYGLQFTVYSLQFTVYSKTTFFKDIIGGFFIEYCGLVEVCRGLWRPILYLGVCSSFWPSICVD